MSFKQWWEKPLRTRDKVAAVFIGALGGFWIGLLGRLLLGATPVSFELLAVWAGAGLVIGMILGILFPRAVSVVLFPFSIFGF